MTSGKKGVWLFAVVALSLLALDLWTKHEAVARLGHEGAEYQVWEGVFSFRLVYNPGMMWGMAQDVPRFVWVAIRGGVLIALFWLYLTMQPRSWLAEVAFGFVAAGAMGNIYDNLFFVDAAGRHAGEVRDFLHFYWFEFPTFNVADACICVGAPLLLCVLWNHDRRKAEHAATAKPPAA